MADGIIIKGVIRGKTVELEQESGLPDGQEVRVTMEPAPASDKSVPGEGLRRSAGAWCDDTEGLEQYIEWNRQQRKLGRKRLEP